nr:hypothetical protein [Pseudomonas aeruginosa]
MSPSRALSPLSRALLLACLGGPVLVSAGRAAGNPQAADARVAAQPAGAVARGSQPSRPGR